MQRLMLVRDALKILDDANRRGFKGKAKTSPKSKDAVWDECFEALRDRGLDETLPDKIAEVIQKEFAAPQR